MEEGSQDRTASDAPAGTRLADKGIAVEHSTHPPPSLEEVETQFRLLAEEARDLAIFLMDTEGFITTWNEAAHQMKGWPVEEAIGQHYRVLYQPEDAEAGKPEEHLEVARTTGKFTDTWWRQRRDGSIFWAEVHLTPLWDEAGNLRGFAKVTQDRSKERALEDDLRQRLDQLAEADKRKDEFLAILAHELRSPLSAVSSATAVLEQIRLDERGMRQLAAIKRQSSHLARLVEDLMDVSRIGRGKTKLQLEPLEAAVIVRDAVEVALPLLDSRGQDLTCAHPSERLLVNADRTRLVQVIVNLLNNAATYSEVGNKVWLTVEREGDAVAIRVRDEGIGINPIILPTLFDLFAQVASEEGDAHGGLGIGLHLVKCLVELHQGTITASSEGLRKGAEFIVRLPLFEEEAA